MAPSRQIGVLMSGGLDSAALIGITLQEKWTVWPVYIQCGLRWEKNEIFWAKKFLQKISSPKLKPLKILNLSLEDAYERNWSKTGHTPDSQSPDDAVFLPARNLLLITKSLLYLTSHNVYQLALATLKGNPFPDGKPSYFKRLNEILSLGFNRRVTVSVPFQSWTKKKVLQKANGLPLHLSYSCINPKGSHHCGKCNKCAERKRAFKRANIEDRSIYAH